jgi:rhamnosyltransferase subunit B
LSPAIVRNAENPPRLSPWWFEPRRPPWLVKAAYAMADYFVADRFLAPSINATRKRLGLAPVKRILNRWWLSPDLVLGLYPQWFGDAGPDCLGAWKACGFPVETASDSAADGDAAPRLFAASEKPVFVTPGTAHQHARDFFLNAMDACARVGKCCVLATSHREQLPEKLPAHASSLGYANLRSILPACAAIMHHGGVGTTAMAFSTGCPQLVCPMAFDQFHNADRVQQLGVGRVLGRHVWKHGHANANDLAGSLRAILEGSDMRLRCDEFAGLTHDFQGAVVAADAIIDLLPFGI